MLLTPRDPAFNDSRNRKALAGFVQKRRAFLKARQGTKRDMRQFQKKCPNWKDLAPNRFASHFYMLESSNLYRRVSGEDLIEENLDLHFLDDGEDEEKKGNKTDKETGNKTK
jgi:hypothetical protein